jgi:hypothetical protein
LRGRPVGADGGEAPERPMSLISTLRYFGTAREIGANNAPKRCLSMHHH